MNNRPQRTLAVFAGVMLGLLVLFGVEISIRFLDPNWILSSGNNDIIALHKYSRVYGWVPRAYSKGTLHGAAVSINAYGYRGAAHSYTKPRDKKRIVILGDSNSFGYGVSDGSSFSDLLEKEGKCEVVNLSVQGYGTDQEYLMLINEGVKYSPDIVILGFTLENDFIDNKNVRFIYDEIHLKPYFSLDGDKLVLHDSHLEPSVFQMAVLGLNDTSALFNVCVNSILGLSWRRRLPGREQDLSKRVSPDLTLALLKEIGKVVRRINATLLVVLFPSEYMPADNPLVETLYFSGALKDVEVLDLGKLFEQYGFADVFLEDGHHLNEKGHRIIFLSLQDAIDSACKGR